MSAIHFPKVYRLKRTANIWKYLAKAKEMAIYEMQNKMESVYRAWRGNPRTAAQIRAAFQLSAEQQIADQHCGCYMYDLYKRSVGSGDMSNFDLTADIEIVFHDKRYYLFPHSQGLFEHIFDFMALDKEVEDFSYNSMRKSPRVSDEDWNDRGAVWHQIVNSQSFDLNLFFHIMSPESFESIDPALEMMRRQKAAEKAPMVHAAKPDDFIEIADEDLVEEQVKSEAAPKAKKKRAKRTSKKRTFTAPTITPASRQISEEDLTNPDAIAKAVGNMRDEAEQG